MNHYRDSANDAELLPSRFDAGNPIATTTQWLFVLLYDRVQLARAVLDSDK
jgi:hypothetical protein